MGTALGNHILVEFMNCDPHIMNDVVAIERDMVGAAQKAGATVINSTFHHFSPYGVSGVVVIQESHLAIHTWPEYGYAAVDLFTCGEMNAWISFDHLKECFGAKSYSAIELKRGSLNLLKRNDFDISTTKVMIWAEPRNLNDATQSAFQDVDGVTKIWAESLIEPYCGPSINEGISGIRPDAEAKSYAITRLGDGTIFGLLVMASNDESRFYPEMGTLFVRRIGELVSAAIQQHLS
jgi:S-adenosylmethionine decarboxylase proenzyme